MQQTVAILQHPNQDVLNKLKEKCDLNHSIVKTHTNKTKKGQSNPYCNRPNHFLAQTDKILFFLPANATGSQQLFNSFTKA
ncbi:hypothetical protein JCM14076_28490 [Methylosoma difficile]